MSSHTNSTMTTCTFGDDAVETQKCDVTFSEDGEILISYEGDDIYIVYRGNEKSAGHYLLEGEPAGRASLHRFPGSMILEGYWEESGENGMWRIQLATVADAVTGLKCLTPPVDEKLEEDEEEEDDSWGELAPRIYAFPLRYDWNVSLSLPNDITRREGRRLASFVKSLSCDD